MSLPTIMVRFRTERCRESYDYRLYCERSIESPQDSNDPCAPGPMSDTCADWEQAEVVMKMRGFGDSVPIDASREELSI